VLSRRNGGEHVELKRVGGRSQAITGRGSKDCGRGVALSVLIASTLGWPTLVSPASIVASVVFSMIVGVVFGYYPARKAAALDPIDALRFE